MFSFSYLLEWCSSLLSSGKTTLVGIGRKGLASTLVVLPGTTYIRKSQFDLGSWYPSIKRLGGWKLSWVKFHKVAVFIGSDFILFYFLHLACSLDFLLVRGSTARRYNKDISSMAPALSAQLHCPELVLFPLWLPFPLVLWLSAELGSREKAVWKFQMLQRRDLEQCNLCSTATYPFMPFTEDITSVLKFR